MTMMLTMMTSGGTVYAEPEEQCQVSELPPNVDVSTDLARVLKKLYARSETFRGQCERIAGAATTLHVTVRLDNSLPSRCRAYTSLRRLGRTVNADMRLPPGRALIEMIGHEFEHVVEQIEGINLRTLARQRGSGVWEVDAQVFETERAQHAGRLVALESAKSRSAD